MVPLVAVAPPEGGGRKGGSFFLWVDVQKLCNMCVHCSKCVSFWGTSYTLDPYTPTPSSLPPCCKILAAPLVGGTSEMGMVGPTLLFNAVTYMALTVHKSEN